MRTSIIPALLSAALLLLVGAGCPGANEPVVEQPPPRSPSTDSGSRQEGSTDFRDPRSMLKASLERMEARIARYRTEKPGTPGIDRAAELLKDAAAELAELDPSQEQHDYMMRVHRINTKFYDFEQILPPLR
jgi:hypothetical protein